MPPLPPGTRKHCVPHEGSGPAQPPRRRSQAGLGRCPTGSFGRQRLQNAKKESPPPLGRAGSRDKMVPFRTHTAVARWQGQDSGLPCGDEGAGPTGGRLPQAGARKAGGELGWALWPAPAHSPSHPQARTQQLLLVVLLLLLQEAGGGWCIKGEAPPNRVSSPRTLPQQQWESRQRLLAALCCRGVQAAAKDTWTARVSSLQVHRGKKKAWTRYSNLFPLVPCSQGRHRACVQESLS